MALRMAISLPNPSTSMSSTATSTSCFRWQQSGSSNLCFNFNSLSNTSLKDRRQTLSLKKKSDAGLGFGIRQNRRGLGVCVAALKKLDEVEAIDLASGEAGKEIPDAAGVYAVYDKEGTLQFLGISRRILASVQTHLQDLPDLCGSVKVAVTDASDKAALTEAWKEWIQQSVVATGEAPPGNQRGVTTWTSRKNRATKPELKMTPGPQKELNVPLTELIDKVVKEIPIVAFIKGTRTAPQCGFSHRVLTILNENHVDYEVVNVLDEHHNPGLREAIKVYSKWPTIPQLYVKGEFVGGADIITELAESGEIKTLIKK